MRIFMICVGFIVVLALNLLTYLHEQLFDSSVYEVLAMMMTADKIDFFKESVNATYAGVPGALANTGQTNQMDFMKTLEKSANAESFDFMGGSKVNQDVNLLNNNVELKKNDERLTKEKAPDQRESTNLNKTDKTDNEKDKKAEPEKVKEKPKEQLTENESKSNTDKTTSEQAEGAPVKKSAVADERTNAIKEILKQHRVQVQRIGEIKEDMKENFTENKAISQTNTTEKIMLKKLGDEKETQAQTSKTKTAKGDETNTDKKSTKEMEAIQKDETATLTKNEPKAEKTVKNADSQPVNLANDPTKTPNLTQEAKLSKTQSSQQTLLDQYQGLKDKINQNVENSIKFMLANGENRVSMKLYPPELGRVEVELTIKDSKISAKINTENIAVKEVIQSNLDQLKSNLQNAGTTIHKMDVEVGGFKNQFDQQFSNGAMDGGSGRRGSSQNGTGEGGSSRDPNEPSPGKIVNQKAISYFLGRSINVII